MNKQLDKPMISAEERAARVREQAAIVEAQEKMAAENRKRRQEQAAEKARQEEDEFIERISLVSSKETREHLLERVRQMREQKPPELNFRAPFITPRMQDQTNAEMEAGRKAVAKATAQQEENRSLRERVAAQEEARLGHMTPVYVPNPTQNEVFPTNKPK